MMTPGSNIACDTTFQTGGIIFSLPEIKYWDENKSRLDMLVNNFQCLNPGLKVKALFTYFPVSNTEIEVARISDLLGLESNPILTDYHILIMNPKTIVNRLREEIYWISCT
ncbi:hypothetical protein BD770DRAFT_438987 [Pilaira anomala]|nr:hypothetical protein BD770DRAFT_438987 [Pilaira anomala]